MQPRISYLIKRIERGVRAELDAALRPLGVSTPEYTALSVLRMRSGLSSAQLARRAFVSGQAMNQIVISLEQRELITRSADPDHGKILRAQLTRKGSALLKLCDGATSHVERLLTSTLSEQQESALREALMQCGEALDHSDVPSK
jgi:DNA-binding MarR family transcriptional regulator